mmetsp:Transcript_28904/g.47957  ORF Transcript_28904/g.47957 Transcript_28904/m.47957 type:complete len:378 (-) Transcript_28904:293-1426(-)
MAMEDSLELDIDDESRSEMERTLSKHMTAAAQRKEKDLLVYVAEQILRERAVVTSPAWETLIEHCRTVSYKERKETEFKLASSTLMTFSGIGHASIGGAAILDGCPVIGKTAQDDIAFLIIDPQVDFHEGGSLAVTGANADSEKIASLLRKYCDRINRVVVTLDTHHPLHIAHSAFWKGVDGTSPSPFTEITSASIRKGTWTPRQPELAEWALEYTDSLEEGGRFTLLIWPNHCLVGSPGHSVSPVLMPALNDWTVSRARTITWVLKGQNNRTEMYSAIKAEVPVEDDPATSLNSELVSSLIKHKQVVVCGEAKSHCVNFTLRDLVSVWPRDRMADLVLLRDCCSAVSGYEAQAEKFENDMRAAGVTVLDAAEFQPA